MTHDPKPGGPSRGDPDRPVPEAGSAGHASLRKSAARPDTSDASDASDASDTSDASHTSDASGGSGPPPAHRGRRPVIERIGLALIALMFAALFGAVALAAWSGGEPFLAALGAFGCGMTLWVGGLTLFRG